MEDIHIQMVKVAAQMAMQSSQVWFFVKSKFGFVIQYFSRCQLLHLCLNLGCRLIRWLYAEFLYLLLNWCAWLANTVSVTKVGGHS
jgi:hypothetical protein